MEDDDIVEVRGAPAPPRPVAPPDEPLLDRSTKVALVAFVIALGVGVAAIVIAVAAY